MRRHPARRAHASASYALRHTIPHARVLRSPDPAGVEQQMRSRLALSPLPRRTMAAAAESRPGPHPDRCGVTTAYPSARDLLIRAEGSTGQRLGEIGHRLRSAPPPARRPRVSTRQVKSPLARYAERTRDGRPDDSRAVTSLTSTPRAPPPREPPLPATTIPPYAGPGPTSNRMTRVLDPLPAAPGREGRARQIAELLGDVTRAATYRPLARRTEKGLIKRARTGRYTADPPTTPSRVPPPTKP